MSKKENEQTAKRQNITFLWEPDLIKELKKRADKENRSLNNYLETLLKTHIKK